uniref:HAT C-terminal dimerisation domain-containing protein n=1 Tax=Latimeria chalumnae TaxID=7897 RepID=H3AQJ8_LATCH
FYLKVLQSEQISIKSPMENAKNSKTEDAVTATELAYVFHGVKHHYSYLPMDCGNKLATHLHSDSSLASKMKLGRTKIENLVENVLGPFSVKRAVEKLKASGSPFAIATDASNKRNRKFFPLAARFFDAESGKKDVLLDFYEEPDEPSESVTKCIIDAVNNLGLDLKDIIAYEADNASVNYGKNCSVFVKLKELQPQIIQVNCNCLVLHNAAKHSMKALSFDMEHLALKVLMSFHAVQKKKVPEVLQEYSKVLLHVPTSWLSLFAAVKRLLLNWEAIKVYFLQLGESHCNNPIWRFIGDQQHELSDKLTLPECYIYFVHSIMVIFQKSICIPERDAMNATELYNVISEVSWLAGKMVNKALPHLPRKAQEKFKTEAKAVYNRAVAYLEKWFSFENSPFKSFSCLSFKEMPSFDDILKLSVDGDASYKEFCLVHTAAPAIMEDESLTGPAEKWRKFFKADQALNFLTIIQYVFSVPCTNAFVERVFSVLGNLWTDERNRLGVGLVKSELCIRYNLKYSCLEFHDVTIKNKTLLAAAKSNSKYKFKKKRNQKLGTNE